MSPAIIKIHVIEHTPGYQDDERRGNDVTLPHNFELPTFGYVVVRQAGLARAVIPAAFDVEVVRHLVKVVD